MHQHPAMKLSKRFRNALVEWYSQNKRDLPWRRTRSTYHIWLSEIMLQQTRVETVIPYYTRFLQRFPTIEALAKADLQEVLKMWEGLGYYSRVRNMHKAAKIITEEFSGRFPESFREILDLPGIGRYSAGAISSIALDQARPVLDGNVTRVLSRYFGIETDASTTAGKNEFWKLAEEIVPVENPGTYNQAIMELGALVCLPRNPNCRVCPLSTGCQAKRTDRQHELPVRKRRSASPHFNIGAGLVWKDDKLLITRRNEDGLLGGLWQFPGGKQEKGESILRCVQREIEEELGVKVLVRDHFMTVKHAYTHFRITLQIFNCQWSSGEPECKACTDYRWVDLEEIDDFPFPRANKRVVEKLLAAGG